VKVEARPSQRPKLVARKTRQDGGEALSTTQRDIFLGERLSTIAKSRDSTTYAGIGVRTKERGGRNLGGGSCPRPSGAGESEDPT